MQALYSYNTTKLSSKNSVNFSETERQQVRSSLPLNKVNRISSKQKHRNEPTKSEITDNKSSVIPFLYDDKMYLFFSMHKIHLSRC